MNPQEILAALGIAVWVRRSLRPPTTAVAPTTPVALAAAPPTARPLTPIAAPPPVATAPPLRSIQELLAHREAMQAAKAPTDSAKSPPKPPTMPKAPPATPPLFDAPPTMDARSDRIRQMDWPELTQAIVDCRACGLCMARQQVVVGAGHRQAELMIVGEGPGADEDKQGEPFVGRSGQLLNAMLFAMNQAREDIYIANAVKCRPPQNRAPHADELAACRPFLDRQIALIRPKIVVALGLSAAKALINSQRPMGKLRGQRLSYDLNSRPIPLFITYHPSYLLRSPTEKSKAWEDLCALQDWLDELTPPTATHG